MSEPAEGWPPPESDEAPLTEGALLALEAFEACYDALDVSIAEADTEAVGELVEARGALLERLLSELEGRRLPRADVARLEEREAVTGEALRALSSSVLAQLLSARQNAVAQARYAQNGSSAEEAR
jgi:hypothetical protein